MPHKKLSVKARWLLVGAIAVLLALVAGLFLWPIHQFSLAIVASEGGPTAEAPREKEGYIFSLPVELLPNYRLPFTVQDITVYDGVTWETLSPVALLCDLEAQEADYPAIGHITLAEAQRQGEVWGKPSEDGSIRTKRACLLLSFETLPPQEHGARVVISYALYGTIQRQETLRLVWD